MASTWAWLVVWIAAWSLAAFLLCVVDKTKARRGGRRVPERTLLGFALAGGSLGLLLGMVLVRHKVAKPRFLLALLVIVALQLAAALILQRLVGALA